MIARTTLATFLVASTAQGFSFGLLLGKRNNNANNNYHSRNRNNIPQLSDENHDHGARRAAFFASSVIMAGLLVFTAQPSSALSAECETECIYRCTKQIPHDNNNNNNKEVLLVEQCRLQCSQAQAQAALTCRDDDASKIINPNTPAPHLLPGRKAGTSIVSLYPTWQDSMGDDDDDMPSVIQAAPRKVEKGRMRRPAIMDYMATRQVWLEELEKL
jgi:hypothetical protein